MHFRQEIGKWGENLACQYLEKNHYQIIDKNFWCHLGEIDIIAKDLNKKELAFIEVKTRTSLRYGNPAEAVTAKKLRHIKHTIEYFMVRKHLENVAIRIDVIEVLIQKQGYRVNHIRQIL